MTPPLPGALPGVGWAVVFGDIDGDGDDDLMRRSSNQEGADCEWRIYANRGGGVYAPAHLLVMTIVPRLVDFNGDGQAELLADVMHQGTCADLDAEIERTDEGYGGLDDDFDGETDENLGPCCVNGVDECAPEVCDGLDSDRDDKVDEETPIGPCCEGARRILRGLRRYRQRPRWARQPRARR